MSLLDQYAQYRKRLDTAVQSALENELTAGLKAEVSRSVHSRVYALYSPTQYGRRKGGGGLSDEDNYRTQVKGSVLTLANETNGNAEQAGEGYDPGHITGIIESGSGYHWHKSGIYDMQPYPRPFMDAALSDYAKIAPNELKAGLKARGF